MTRVYSDFEVNLFYEVGGKHVSHGNSGYWDFGWINFENRTDEQEDQHDKFVATLQPFKIDGPSNDTDKADIIKFWNHEKVVQALGWPYTGTHQLTGSCVGAGGGNVAASLNFREVIVSGDPDKIILVFYPYTYGRSRMRAGMRGRGEGSTGSGWMEAATKDGVIDNKVSGLPQPQSHNDGIIWGKDVEMSWSAGDREPCTQFLAEGQKHLIKTASQMRSHDDVWTAIVNGYPVTCASMYAFEANVQDGVLLGRHKGSWSHQMSMHACWNHPKHGKIFWLHNQWGLNAHGKCPSGMPGGGAWITAKDVDWICGRGGEVYAFSFYDGYKSLDLDWDSI
jgi:hypothetical protein